jgi:hypothetical protein
MTSVGPGGPGGGPQQAPQPVSPPQWPPPWIEPAVRDLFAVAAQLRADVFQVAATYNMNRSVVYASTLQKVLNPSLMGDGSAAGV